MPPFAMSSPGTLVVTSTQQRHHHFCLKKKKNGIQSRTMRWSTTRMQLMTIQGKLLRMKKTTTMTMPIITEFLLWRWRGGSTSFSMKETGIGLRSWKPPCGVQRRSSSRKKWRCPCGRTRLSWR